MLDRMAEAPPAGPRSEDRGGRLPRRFARNAASNYALTAVLAAVALVTTPILTRHLGPQRFGVWVFVGSVVTYVQLLDLGLGGSVVATLARLSGQGAEDELEGTLTTSFFLLVLLGVLALVVCGAAAEFLPRTLHLDPTLRGTTRDLLLLLGLDVAVSIPMDTFGCGLVALQRFDLLNATLVGVALGQAVAWVVVMVAVGGGLIMLGLVTIGISLAGQGVRYVLLRRLLPGLRITPAGFDRSRVRALASPAGWYALGDVITNFLDQASVLILGIVRNVTSSGLFAVGQKLATLGTQMGTAVSQPLFPHAAALVGQGDESTLGETTRSATVVSAGATVPFCLIVGVLARPALLAWVGPTYARAATAVVILAVAYGIKSFLVAPVMITSGAGGQRVVALLDLAKGVVQVVLAVVLGAAYGVTGVAWAVLVTTVAVDVCWSLPLLHRRFGARVLGSVVPVVRSHAAAFVVAGVLGGLLAQGPVLDVVRHHGRFTGIAVVAGAGLLVLVVYAALYTALGMDRATRHSTVARIRAALRRR
ncbi:MAG TPA: lipopolysaccharide biosynthesis protein [Acidimicrobiales bacterium]|nr:lipopolysaccharide biosynthesis protein [Acidimicrobiales bacterium]